MARVLVVGIDPEEVDFSDPALPPGMDAEMIRRGIRRAREELAAAGHGAQHLSTSAGPSAPDALRERLARDPVD